jgi:hypothetical protein
MLLLSLGSIGPILLVIRPILLVIRPILLGIRPILLGIGPILLGIGLALDRFAGLEPRHEVFAGFWIVKSKLRTQALKMQPQDLARQPAIHRLDRHIIAINQAKPLEWRIKLVFGRIEEEILPHF